jgi:glycosyltransferase involved in cell wall biosynthesis
MRVLLLTTDAYGGHGGIALYNRDVVDALAASPEIDEIVVVPRTQRFPADGVPDKVRFIAAAAGSKLRFVRAAFAAARGHFDLVICGHINLLPLAALLNLKLRAPLALMVYGIDAWRRPGVATRFWLRQVDAIWSISAITRDRMNEWAGIPESKFVLLPNAIHQDRYGLAEKRADLVARFGLAGRKVIMTLARLPSFERYKGVDEVLEVLPSLMESEPALTYLVVGDGDDRPRLEAKAKALGLENSVSFSGFVDEADKADYFRLADAFVMPGRGEGFGFVFLEALACGVPAVGSLVDGSREALLDGELGELVDPVNPLSIREGIERALAKPKAIPQGLSYFSWPHFRLRLAAAVNSLARP